MGERKLEESIENGLMPELKDDVFVVIGGKKICVRELPIFYVKQINRKLGPLYDALSGGKKIEAQDLINLDKMENFYDILIEISLIIIEYHAKDENITKEFLEKNSSERLLLDLIHKQLQANGMLDFLEKVLKGVMTVMGTFGTEPRQENMPNM